MKKDFKFLIGMKKKEVLIGLGDHFNFFQSDVWTYEIGKRNWLGIKTILFIFFENEKVINVKIKKSLFQK